MDDLYDQRQEDTDEPPRDRAAALLAEVADRAGRVLVLMGLLALASLPFMFVSLFYMYMRGGA